MTLGRTVSENASQVDELRRRMKGLMPQEMFEDDSVFQRFLKARSYNLDAAETMLKNNIKWRQINKADSILTDYKPNEVLQKYTVLNKLAFDKDGSPVLYAHYGNVDSRGILRSVKKSDLTDYILYTFEDVIAEMKKQSEKVGKPIHQWSWIFNYESFSVSMATHRPTIEFLIHLISMYEANYPERLKAAYLINGSRMFTICFSFLKPFLSGPTFNKVKIFGKDGWQDELRSIIDADQLPAFLGGNRTDPDGNPRCTETVKFGGKVDERYYFQRNSRSLSLKPGAMKLTVNRLSKAEIQVGVLQPGAIIEWEFNLKCRDVYFVVVLKEDTKIDSAHKEVLPKQKIEAGLTEAGAFKCDKAGLYALEFDNTYSWIYSKQITYTTSLSNS